MQKSARSPRGVVDAISEMGETWTEIGKRVDKKEIVQYLPFQII